MQKLLLFTSDRNYGPKLASALKEMGYQASMVSEIDAALELFLSQRPDLLLFDLASLEDGIIKALKNVRRQEGIKDLPVLALVEGKALRKYTPSLGIDDFVVKNSDPLEIKARIQQIFWRLGKVDQENIVKIDGLLLDLANYEVTLQGIPITLTYREYELLKFLILNRGRVYTRDVLLDKVWGYDNYAGTRTVDIHIQRLRTKLGGHYGEFIQTVRSVGYKFAVEQDKH